VRAPGGTSTDHSGHVINYGGRTYHYSDGMRL